ncbi:MAG TPA: response regulator transcription factor, partial [Burkholderiales bacterium]|nr:response regulator transcription factor [Burkholderiales bacterium]
MLQALDRQIELLEAQACDEALELTRRHQDTALILLDLALPGTDGFAALRQFREEFPGIPVVVVSAYDQAEVVTRAIDTGAMGFIPKTSSTQILLNALKLVLSGGVYLPPELLRKHDSIPPAAPQLATSPAQLRDPREIGLTERQSQVLTLLV